MSIHHLTRGLPPVGCPQLLIQYAAALHMWRPSSASATWWRAMPWWQRAHSTQNCILTYTIINGTFMSFGYLTGAAIDYATG